MFISRKSFQSYLILGLFLCTCSCVLADEPSIDADLNRGTQNSHWHSDRADGHAPIGVMGDHMHAKGESMASYRFMAMGMDGNRDGTDRVSDADVLSQFMVTPTDMDMRMHMFGYMYAPEDWVTLSLMVPYTELSMNHITRMGARFKTKASGLGDIQLAALWKLYEADNQQIHFRSGISLPSGEIDERDDTPAGVQLQLPYPMQLGSGTVDIIPALTYLGESEQLSWGAQAVGTIRTGKNDNDYTLGDRLESSAWVAHPFTDWISASFRLAYQNWGNIDGADPLLNPAVIPTADPGLRGGKRLDIGIGVNFYVPEGDYKGFRVASEFLVPVHQDLDGPQLETDWSFVTGIQVSF